MKRHVVYLLFAMFMAALTTGIEGCKRADNSGVAPGSADRPASGASY
ncbi:MULTISPECIES: hypothetical protein [Mycetohabitans]|nr:hypothetical protein [Mycetohabitans sp. B3]MCF2133808.1 hypothetical protein [Mycetohabitans sp. B3]